MANLCVLQTWMSKIHFHRKCVAHKGVVSPRRSFRWNSSHSPGVTIEKYIASLAKCAKYCLKKKKKLIFIAIIWLRIFTFIFLFSSVFLSHFFPFISPFVTFPLLSFPASWVPFGSVYSFAHKFESRAIREKITEFAFLLCVDRMVRSVWERQIGKTSAGNKNGHTEIAIVLKLPIICLNKRKHVHMHMHTCVRGMQLATILKASHICGNFISSPHFFFFSFLQDVRKGENSFYEKIAKSKITN